MVRIFGAPVTEAKGKRAAMISATDAPVLASTVEVIWNTVGWRSTSNLPVTVTVPFRATRPTSLRTMSTIMAFSARSFSDSANRRS